MWKFILAYFLIYGGVHVVFFHRIKILLPYKTWVTTAFTLFLLLMTLSPLITRILEVKVFDGYARYAAYVTYFWMGFLFLAFSGSLLMYCYDFISWGLRTIVSLPLPALSGKTPVWVLLGICVLFMIYGYFEALHLQVERVVMKTDKLPSHVSSIRIVQISDVHLGIIHRDKQLKRILNAVAAQSPDMLVCTGDLVDGSMHNLAHLPRMMEKIKPIYGKFAITGNHEYYAGLDHSIEFMEKSGFEVLRQEVRTVDNLINVAGVDDGGRFSKIKENGLLSSIDNNLFTLYLKHRPDVSENTLGHFDLQLSGHTHNGQMWPFNYLVLLEFRMIKGIYELDKGSTLYVNRGTGTWGPPIRIFSPPEITVIDVIDIEKENE